MMGFLKFGPVLLISLLIILPVSGAFSSTVVLHPRSDQAMVSMEVNSTLNITWKEAFSLNLGNFNSSADLNFSADALQVQALNSSLSSLEKGLSVSDVNVSFNYTSSLSTQDRFIHESFSLNLSMMVSGITTGNVVNMTWRSFSYRGNLSHNGINVNGVGTDSSLYINMDPNFLNFSSFAVPLTDWNGSFLPTTNQTVFQMQSSYSLNSSAQNGLVNFSLRIDPEYTIIAPGYDSAHANTITIGNPPASHGYLYYLIAGAFVIIALGSYYAARRKR